MDDNNTPIPDADNWDKFANIRKSPTPVTDLESDPNTNPNESSDRVPDSDNWDKFNPVVPDSDNWDKFNNPDSDNWDADKFKSPNADIASNINNLSAVQALRRQNSPVSDGDWRVRLRLAPGATYLYNAPNPGILAPLRKTSGVIFPYTPTISVSYGADYSATDLTHSNYKNYFYKGSSVGDISLSAEFTAQDLVEADYMLAVIHFFKAATKMFYGQDSDRGAPPPLVFLSGLGQFQFNEHPCVIKNFDYRLPHDVDYIRARNGQNIGDIDLLWQRQRANTGASSGFSFSSILARLSGANIPKGAVIAPRTAQNIGLQSPTYVPTKLAITLSLSPIQSREQVSQQFSLQQYASGELLKKGFW